MLINDVEAAFGRFGTWRLSKRPQDGLIAKHDNSFEGDMFGGVLGSVPLKKDRVWEKMGTSCNQSCRLLGRKDSTLPSTHCYRTIQTMPQGLEVSVQRLTLEPQVR